MRFDPTRDDPTIQSRVQGSAQVLATRVISRPVTLIGTRRFLSRIAISSSVSSAGSQFANATCAHRICVRLPWEFVFMDRETERLLNCIRIA